MALRDVVKNERIVNQANYLLTSLTTLLTAVVSVSVQGNFVHAMYYPLLVGWVIVFVLRAVERVINRMTEKSMEVDTSGVDARGPQGVP